MDTAMNACVAALACGDKLYYKFEPQIRGQAERLVPMCDELFKEAGVSPKELTQIAVTVGPGAFTGLRVGMSAARIMGLALDIPVIGLTTCELIAAESNDYIKDNNMDARSIAVILETKRSDYYFAHYESISHDVLHEPAALEYEDIQKYICNQNHVFFAGDALPRFFQEHNDKALKYDITAPCPVNALKYIKNMLDRHSELNLAVAPIYLRNADVSNPKKIRQIEN